MKKRVAAFGKDRVEVLDRAERVEDRPAQHEHSLPRRGDLRHVGEVALDDQRAGHAARDLDVGRAVADAGDTSTCRACGRRDGDLDVVALARLHVRNMLSAMPSGLTCEPVRMEIGRVEVVRQVVIRRHRVAVGRQVVDEPMRSTSPGLTRSVGPGIVPS